MWNTSNVLDLLFETMLDLQIIDDNDVAWVFSDDLVEEYE